MKLQEYIRLTQERKFMMVQRDFEQVASDLEYYKKLSKYSPVLGETFRKLNAALNRPVNRTSKDYELVQAYTTYLEAKAGNVEGIIGPRESLDEIMVSWQDDIAAAVKAKSPHMVVPPRGDADGLRQFWLRNSRNLKVEELDALSMFWKTRAVEDLLVRAAGENKTANEIQNILYKQAHHLQRSFAALGVIPQNFDNRAVALRAYYSKHMQAFARMHGKTEDEKIAALNDEKTRLAYEIAWEKSEDSLRPEGRWLTSKENVARFRGNHSELDHRPLPQIVPLQQEVKEFIKNHKAMAWMRERVQKIKAAVAVAQTENGESSTAMPSPEKTGFKKSVTDFMAKKLNARTAVIAGGLGILTVATAAYIVFKRSDHSSMDDPKNPRNNNELGTSSADQEDGVQYEDSDALYSEETGKVVVEDADSLDALDNDSATPVDEMEVDTTGYELYEPAPLKSIKLKGDTISAAKKPRTILNILVDESDLLATQKENGVSLVKDSAEKKDQAANAPVQAQFAGQKDLMKSETQDAQMQQGKPLVKRPYTPQ